MHIHHTSGQLSQAVIIAADNAMDEIPDGCGLIRHIPECVITLDAFGFPCEPLPAPQMVSFARSRAQITDIACDILNIPTVAGIAIYGGYDYWMDLDAAKAGQPRAGRADFLLLVWSRS